MACSRRGPWQAWAGPWAAWGGLHWGGIHVWPTEPRALGQWTEPWVFRTRWGRRHPPLPVCKD